MHMMFIEQKTVLQAAFGFGIKMIISLFQVPNLRKFPLRS
jgi:hypothetical protein